MAALSFLSKLFHSREPTEDVNEVHDLYIQNDRTFLFGPTASGKIVNEFTAMQQSAVYACIRVLAEGIAQLPLNIYEYQPDGTKKKLYDHPLYRILHDQPNPDMTSFVFRETMMGHLCTYGNAYAQIIRNGFGDVVALYPLLPNRMMVGRAETGQLVYAYTTYGDEGVSTTARTHYLREDQVLHIPGLGFDGVMGYSPIAMCRDAVGMGMAAEEFGNKFFNNGARPSGVLSHPGTLKDPQKLRDAWMAAYGGTGNAGKTAVLEEGVKYQAISINPSEAQFLETRKFQLNEICRIYRIPPHMIQDLEHATFSNIEHQSLEFVKFTLNPWVARWEQALYKDLLLPAQKEKMVIKMNVDGLLRGDYQSRMNGYAIARQNGWMSANDIRELEDQNPIPDEEGGNLYLINGNMVKLKDAGIYANKGGSSDTADEGQSGSALTTRR